MKSSLISSIDPNKPESWRTKYFLTLDIDWAHDDILNDSIDLLEEYQVSATWFVTHDTPVLNRLRSNPSFELGIHPNFNFLINGNQRNGIDLNDVIGRLMDIVPEAKSVRSHSLLQSSPILSVFKSFGLTHDVNHLVPEVSGIEIKPWVISNGLIRVPYNWEDDDHIAYEGMGIKQKNPLDICRTCYEIKAFDFHPIHIYLNTESLSRYESTRHLHQLPDKLFVERFSQYGTRNRLIDLLSSCH